jgi:PTS system mannose-specific IIA component
MALHVILSSHGLYAQEALNAVTMIIGEPRLATAVVSVTQGRSMEECYEELTNIFDQIPADDEVLVLVDIFGGTPSNITSMLLVSNGEEARLQAYSGFNLPVLIELLATSPATLMQARGIIEGAYTNALINLNEKMKGLKQDGNQTL